MQKTLLKHKTKGEGRRLQQKVIYEYSAYNVEPHTKKGFAWGSAPRSAKKKKVDGPAPGQYEIPSSFGKGPQYTIPEKRQEKIVATPGPGMYETEVKGEEKSETTSFMNEAEIVKVKEVYEVLKNDYGKVCIISPYLAQVEKIRELLGE